MFHDSWLLRRREVVVVYSDRSSTDGSSKPSHMDYCGFNRTSSWLITWSISSAATADTSHTVAPSSSCVYMQLPASKLVVFCMPRSTLVPDIKSTPSNASVLNSGNTHLIKVPHNGFILLFLSSIIPFFHSNLFDFIPIPFYSIFMSSNLIMFFSVIFNIRTIIHDVHFYHFQHLLHSIWYIYDTYMIHICT